MSFVLWLFEIGYILQHAATISQIWKIQTKKNTEGMSIETNILFLVGACSRIIWMWDSMLKGFFLSYIEIVLALGTSAYFIFLYNKYKTKNYWANEVQLPFYLKLHVLIPVVTILSFLFHPGSKGKYYLTMQMFVSFSIFSEAIGLLPQMHLIEKAKDVGELSKLYVVFLGFARLLRLLFWLKMFYEGNRFTSLIIADLIHCISLFKFIYTVIQNWSGKGLPTTFSETVKEDSTKKMF
jgi:ER lumen protein retaining receptor